MPGAYKRPGIILWSEGGCWYVVLFKVGVGRPGKRHKVAPQHSEILQLRQHVPRIVFVDGFVCKQYRAYRPVESINIAPVSGIEVLKGVEYIGNGIGDVGAHDFYPHSAPPFFVFRASRAGETKKRPTAPRVAAMHAVMSWPESAAPVVTAPAATQAAVHTLEGVIALDSIFVKARK